METNFKTKEDKAKEVLNCKELSDDLKVELIGLLMNQASYVSYTLDRLYVPNKPNPLGDFVYTSSPDRPTVTTGYCTSGDTKLSTGDYVTNNATSTAQKGE